MLSSPPQQQQLNLPLLTQVHQSVTTSMPMMTKTTTTTTTTAIENNEQQQLPTPNTFIRHCDDMGLFHDLQNIVVMSSLTGPSGDTTITSVPASNSATIVTTATSTGQPTSNLFDSTSTAIVTTMMMANPFDETFKQAVLEQQQNEANPSENIFNHNNNNDGDLNTPFIATTTVVNTSNKNTSKCLTQV